MRLAITHPYAWPEVRRGAERMVVETARSLAGRGHHVTVITAGESASRTVTGGVRTVKLRRMFDSPFRHEMSFGARATPYLVAGRFDAVHCMMPWDAYFAVRSRPLGRFRVVYEELGLPLSAYWETVKDARIRRQLVEAVDVYGCMSRYAVDALEREWGRKGEVIPGGVRLSDFPPTSERDPQPTILFSGAVEPWRKGLWMLLKSLDLLIDEVPDVQLWISGPGDAGAALREVSDRVRERVRVLPLGQPEDQGERYRRAWVTALPSVWESFGLVLIESLASGTPIVVLNDAAPPELVTSRTGTLAEPFDRVSLADALRRGLALAEDAETSGHCREFARQFDWDTMIIPLLERIYEGSAS